MLLREINTMKHTRHFYTVYVYTFKFIHIRTEYRIIISIWHHNSETAQWNAQALLVWMPNPPNHSENQFWQFLMQLNTHMIQPSQP